MSYPYPVLGTIPGPNDLLSQSQGQIQTNFANIVGWSMVDHSEYGATNAGTHEQVTLSSNNPPGLPTTFPIVFSNTEDGASNPLPGALAQVFAYSGATGPTGADGQNYLCVAQGSTMLFGGIVLKWGEGSIATGGGGSDVGFASAFPNYCFAVVVSGRNAGNTPGTFNVNAVSKTNFNLYANTSGNFYYIAIGN